MEPSQAEFSPMRAAAVAGRRAVRIATPAEQGAAPQAPEAVQRPAPPPGALGPRAVKFAEPQAQAPAGGASISGSGGADGSGAGARPDGAPAKRVGFAPASSWAGGGGGGDDGPAAPETSPAVAFTGVSRRKQEQLQREQTETAKQRSKYDERETGREVDDIPDLEEEGREDLTRVVAQAPRAQHVRVQAVSELQRDQAWVPAGGGGVDLSLLAACLCPSEQVQEEPDEVWEPDQLLAALKSELLGDCGAAAAAEKDEPRSI